MLKAILLGTGDDGTSPCVLLESGGRRLLINATEGLQRLSFDRALRIHRDLDAILLSSIEPTSTAGLPGLFLLMADAGVACVRVFGPTGTAQLLRSFLPFIKKDLKLLPFELTADEALEWAGGLRVFALPVAAPEAASRSTKAAQRWLTTLASTYANSSERPAKRARTECTKASPDTAESSDEQSVDRSEEESSDGESSDGESSDGESSNSHTSGSGRVSQDRQLLQIDGDSVAQGSADGGGRSNKASNSSSSSAASSAAASSEDGSESGTTDSEESILAGEGQHGTDDRTACQALQSPPLSSPYRPRAAYYCLFCFLLSAFCFLLSACY